MNLGQTFRYASALRGILTGQKAFLGPLRATLGLSNRCNVRCLHCFYYSPYVEKPLLQQLRVAQRTGATQPERSCLKEIQKTDIDMDRLRTVVKELLAMGTRRFEFAGNGEPFIHPQAMELLSFLKQENCFCLVKTNGILIDRNTADELIRIGADELRVTTMAGTPETYRMTHPGVPDTVFAHLRETLIYLGEQKELRRVRHPRVVLSFIPLRQNIEDIMGFARFAVQIKADGVRYWPVSAVDDPGLMNVIPLQEQIGLLHQQLDEARRYLALQRIPCIMTASRRNFYTKLDTSAIYGKIPCYYGWLAVRINADGEVYPCCRCYSSLGNIYQTNFREIWNGLAYRQFRREARSHPQRQSPVKGCDCYSCIHYVANLRVFRALHPIRSRMASHRHFFAWGPTEGE